LLRTNAIEWAIAAAFVAVASKFLLRVDGRHVFNPTNFAIVLMIATTGSAWVSPGQWGTEAYVAFALACLGGIVINRAARSDVTYAFLAFYALLVLGRAAWLGDPIRIPLHHLENGAFLLFAFFMISDPKTTPDSRRGRILFALMVALGAGFVTFVLFRTNGLLWSLVLCCPLTPILNRLFPGERYQWRSGGQIPAISERSFA
jgi:Na+-transporting NADH:ubiquinone oxidoreductase subunit NqrB